MVNVILLFVQVVEFVNFFFEGIFVYSCLLNGWEDCGFEGESLGDIYFDFIFRVIKRVYEGYIYFGLVIWDNNIWELVLVKLKGKLD